MPHPLLYEINTRCWLRALSAEAGRTITLADAPDSELLAWRRLGFTHVWLMGVWTGGARARETALRLPALHAAYSEALPDWTEADVSSSPYAIMAYQVPPAIGGKAGLIKFRQRLRSAGLKLVLDFVPNHLGLDHSWVKNRPELFVQAAVPKPDTFAEDTPVGKRYFAYGKDPNCPAWTDTVQVDYRRTDARAALTGLLQEIAELCDGVRCDMAMLALSDVFANTWKDFPSQESDPGGEFWTEAITAVRRDHPEFLFLAEVYWGLEPRLQELGFDYTYDKVLYDRLSSREASLVRSHVLGMGPAKVAASAHFLENHDERRIASILPLPDHRAAALVILGLPGMRFLHEGQLLGWRRRLPVQLVRRARESENPQIREMYEQLLTALSGSAVGRGTSALLSPGEAWPGNPTAQNFILIQWSASDTWFDLVVVNLAPHAGQCYAPLKLPAVSAPSWSVTDLIGNEHFIRPADDLRTRGLYLDLPAHGGQLFRFEPG